MSTFDHSANVHYVPNDGQRFPLCGSWRSNWNHSGDPERTTCPACRALLTAPPAATPPPAAAGEGH